MKSIMTQLSLFSFILHALASDDESESSTGYESEPSMWIKTGKGIQFFKFSDESSHFEFIENYNKYSFTAQSSTQPNEEDVPEQSSTKENEEEVPKQSLIEEIKEEVSSSNAEEIVKDQGNNVSPKD